MRTYLNATVITGDDELHDHAVIVDGGVVHSLVPHELVPRQSQRIDLGGAVLAPGFVDLQVNGGGDVLFNDVPTPSGLQAIVDAHVARGTTALLPTLITDSDDVMRAAVATVAQVTSTGPSPVVGIHVEGPFLNPARCGVHDPARMRRMRRRDVDLLPMPGPNMAVLVTLAPEMVDDGCIAELRSRGITVFVGHSAADDETARRAFADGASGVTHLFNATGGLQARSPGVVGAALDCDDVWASLICDGRHVHDTSLRVALRAKPGRCLLVSDATPPVGGARDRFTIAGRQVRVVDGSCQTTDGVLAGSAIDMAAGVRHCVTRLGVPIAEAVRMGSTYPARAIGMADSLGHIAVGRRADMVVLDPATLDVLQVIGAS